MAYLHLVADRVRSALADTDGVIEKKMFGSLGFLVNGQLTVGVGDGKDGHAIMVRVGRDAEPAALREPGTAVVEMRGRPMHGWIDLTADAIDTESALRTWLDRALAYVSTLPPKNT